MPQTSAIKSGTITNIIFINFNLFHFLLFVYTLLLRPKFAVLGFLKNNFTKYFFRAIIHLTKLLNEG